MSVYNGMTHLKNIKTHYRMRSFEYLGQIALSLILLIVLTVLPLAPVLASELNVEETTEDT